MLWKIWKWPRIQDFFLITPKIKSVLPFHISDNPWKFHNNPSITFWVILNISPAPRRTKTYQDVPRRTKTYQDAPRRIAAVLFKILQNGSLDEHWSRGTGMMTSTFNLWAHLRCSEHNERVRGIGAQYKNLHNSVMWSPRFLHSKHLNEIMPQLYRHPLPLRE